eukprot:2574290-Ditylum_brightwellii.AAC.1
MIQVSSAEELTKHNYRQEIAKTNDWFNKLVEESKKEHEQNVWDEECRHKKELKKSVARVREEYEHTIKELSA